MSSKAENLEKIKASIFKDLTIDCDEYYEKTPIEKLQFIERAFYKVNHYFKNIHFGLNPKHTKFGFHIGSTSDAITYSEERGVSVNLTDALLNLWPYETYNNLFHEMQHVWNYYATLNKMEKPNIPIYVNNAFEKFLAETKFAFKRPFEIIEKTNLYNTDNYDIAHHAASPNEMFANNTMYMKIDKILKEGIKKTTDEKTLNEAKTIYEDNKRIWSTNNKFHLKAIANLASGGRLFAEGGEEQVDMNAKQGEAEDERCLVLSTYQASKVISEHPRIFSDWKETEAKGEKIFLEYIKSDGEIKHVPEIYFGNFDLTTFKRNFEFDEYAHFDKDGNPVDQDENKDSINELNEIYKEKLAEMQNAYQQDQVFIQPADVPSA